MKITKRLSNKLLFTLGILVLVMFSLSCVSAQDNETVLDASAIENDVSEISLLQSSQVYQEILGTSNNVIKINELKIKLHFK